MAGHGNRYGDATRTRALELLSRGGSVIEVAREVGAARQTVYRWARAANIEPPGTWVFDRAAIRAMFDRGATVHEVAETFGCSVRYAYAVRNGELA